MRPSDHIACVDFPCADVRHECYAIPHVDVRPTKISIVMVSEAAPGVAADHFYAGAQSLFARTTIQAFNDAGEDVTSIQDILRVGVYLTTAVKCGKTGYAIKPATVRACSFLLEKELALFSEARVLMLMGDVAIRALNYIGFRAGEGRVIPAGSTYRLRGREYCFRGMRVFPSYLQAGSSFFIEKSKRRMIAEDIAAALRLVG